MRRVFGSAGVVMVVTAGIFLSSCGGGDGGNNAATGNLADSARYNTPSSAIVIGILDNLYSPRQLSVKVGDEVTWEWDSKNNHSVVGTFDGTAVDSGEKSGRERYSFTFEKPGVFEFHCTVHASMTGKLTVKE